MRASRLVLFSLPLIAGVILGFLMPRWRTVTIEFVAGGREVRLARGEVRRLPSSIDIEDDGRLRLRVVNHDSVPHQAGVLGVPARDSAVVGAESCTGQAPGGTRSMVLQ